MIFCALSNHTIKVRQEQAAIIRFRTLRYDSIRFHMLFGSPGFLAVRPGGALWALRCVRWTTWRSFGSRCTRCRSSPSWACWGTGCVCPASWAPPHHRVVGSCGWELFLLSWQLALAPPICHQITHHAVHFLPFLVGTHEFGSTCVRFQEREKYWNDGLVHVFWDFWEQKQHTFRASAQILHAWRGGFTDVVPLFCMSGLFVGVT